MLRGDAVADPELHFLRGEALLALGRTDEAWRELDRAERELPRDRLDRSGALWLARILARRGELGDADALLRGWLPRDRRSAGYGEIAMARANAHTLAHDWAGAARIVRELLVDQPDHLAGRELLAWVLEVQGALDEELAVRAWLAEVVGPERGGRVLRYARALERDRDDAGALAQYRQADALGAGEVSADITRLAHRIAPEVGAALEWRDDPTGKLQRWRVGASAALGARLRVVVNGSYDRGDDGGFARSALGAAGVLTGRRSALMVGASLHGGTAPGLDAGATARLRTQLTPRVELHASGEVGMPWNDAAITVREGGEVDITTAG